MFFRPPELNHLTHLFSPKDEIIECSSDEDKTEEKLQTMIKQLEEERKIKEFLFSILKQIDEQKIALDSVINFFKRE